jgi:hypothetical protein
LQSGLDALSGTYHFVSTVTIDGKPALVADGDRVGHGSRLTLTSSTGIISYVITPDASWAMPEGGTWQRLDDDPADVDTIAALRAPTAVRIASNDTTTVTLVVTVPQSSLGITGDVPAELTVAVVRGVVQALTYSTTANGKPAAVNSTFGPVQDASPVVAPV